MSFGTRLWAVRPGRAHALKGSISLRQRQSLVNASLSCSRQLHFDGRARLSNEWAPSGGIAAGEDEDAHSKLIRAGFIRQSHSGIFHLLPLGLRVQEKVTRLVDRHMRTLGASRVQLSAISSEALWEQSGRLNKIGSELFRFTDRKEGRYLLGPTHEEEITNLVARSVKSYKNLPLRLYQITQKYRDELRPRHGLLRGREFTMKDLYTFDYSIESALGTYEQVREAYSRIFIEEMKLPVLVAKASSGDMGGSLSHEYHIPTSLGEDHVMNCNSCDYVANEELAESRLPKVVEADLSSAEPKVWRGVSKDRKTLIHVWYDANQASEEHINTHAVKQVFPELDSGLEDPLPFWYEAMRRAVATTGAPLRVVHLLDCRLPRDKLVSHIQENPVEMPPGYKATPQDSPDIFKENLDLHPDLSPQKETANFIRIRDGDPCPRCDEGTLKVHKAIELGHTFHLGTRYSEPLNASVSVPSRLLIEAGEKPPQAGEETSLVPIQMGCHGIGISRIIGAVADHLADKRGLNWPRVIAPYDVVLVYNAKDDGIVRDVETLYDMLIVNNGESAPLDAIIDDRGDSSMGWKLKDADLVGYPVIVVVGREWKASGRLEVQCRRLGFKELVEGDRLQSCVAGLLGQL